MARSESRPLRVYLNGRMVPYYKATISVEDRGFSFGDGIYEVVRCYGGTPFRLDDHLARLAHDAAVLKIPLTRSNKALTRAVKNILAANRLEETEASVYIQLSRGAAPRSHAFPSSARPTLLIIARPVHSPSETLRARGAAAVTFPDIRSSLVSMKTLNLLPNILAKEAARRRRCYEAIFIRKGYVTEGASTNVFIVRNGRLLTPSANGTILAGVTRSVILELARKMHIPSAEQSVDARQIRAADEIFLTASITEIMPVIRLDGRRIGTGKPGPVTRTLREAFRRCTREAG